MQELVQEDLQSGLTELGEAMTMPDLAPEARHPLGPMLQRSCCRARGVSVDIKEETSRLRSAGALLGQARTPWTAMLPSKRAAEKKCIMGCKNAEVSL